MKYYLPEDLKRHLFVCDQKTDMTTYRGCKRRCHKEDCRQCWELHLRKDLQRDCDIENETNARRFVTCPNCGERYDIGLLFNRFGCSKCGATVYCDAAEQKQLMGNAYFEIDEQELTEMLNAIK